MPKLPILLLLPMLLLPMVPPAAASAGDDSDGYRPLRKRGRLDPSASRYAPPPELPSDTAAVDSAGSIVIMFTGDTKLCGRTALQISSHGPSYPFSHVAKTLRSAAIAFTNCETAITDYPVHTPGKSAAAVSAGRAFVFRSDPATSGGILRDAGIDIVQLANNHAMDWCGQGLLDTCAALDSVGIAYVGAGPDYGAAKAPVVVESGGVRVGYLAYSLIVPLHSAAGQHSPGINTLPAAYPRAMSRDIAALRQLCDVAVVGFHWGKESTTAPSPQQVAIGHAAIDAGADLVVGTHTHSLQGVEFYRHGVIAYSLGNFVFTGASRKLAGGILRVEVNATPDAAGSRIAGTAFLPCWIMDGVPTPSSDKALQGRIADIFGATRASVLALIDGGWLPLSPEG